MFIGYVPQSDNSVQVSNQSLYSVGYCNKLNMMPAYPSEQQPSTSRFKGNPNDPHKLKLKFSHPKLINAAFEVDKDNYFSQMRMILKTYSLLNLHENYQLSYRGHIVSNFDTVGMVLVNDGADKADQIDVQLTPYDYRTAHYHFQQVVAALNDPISLLFFSEFKHQKAEEKNRSYADQIYKHNSENTPLTIDSVLAQSLTSELLKDKNVRPVDLIQFLTYSGFNPPPENEKLNGDLFYLHLKTLEGLDYHITACEIGFYVNQSKISNFNPAMNSAKLVFASLLDLIANVSDRYFDNMQKFLADNVLTVADYERQKLSLTFGKKVTQNQSKWLADCEHQHTWNNRKHLKQEELPQEKFDDWTEAFLACKKMEENKDKQGMRHISRKRVTEEFEETAVQGARLLVDGRIIPLNPLDEKRKQIYIYKRIFFSMANETIFNHSQEKGEDATPSSSSINTDLINLNILQALDIPQLNVLNSVIVSYRGFKIIAQCIIPGLLSAQPNNCTQYGSLDDGKTIETNPQFHAMMKIVCAKVHIEDDLQVKDAKGEIKNVAASPDIKGILGSNAEKYIVDLFRLSPRDLNYLGAENESCVLRPELVQAYKKLLSDEKMIMPKINVNIGTETQFLATQRTKQQHQLLLNMALYLKETAIVKLIESLKTKGQSYLTDSKGISHVFHQFGVNLRYLGYVIRHQKLKNSEQVKLCLNRVILVKCFKHLFKLGMRESNILYLNSTITHMLNCLFGRKMHINILEAGKNPESNNKTDTGEGKKKKNKKKETQKVVKSVQDREQDIKVDPPLYLSLKPHELWEIVMKISLARYDYQLQSTLQELNETGLFRSNTQKMAILRDLCLTIGLVLERTNYNIFELKEFEPKESLPFAYKNIAGLIPIPKRIKQIPKEVQMLVQLGDSQMQTGSLRQAMQSYSKALQLSHDNYLAQQVCALLSKQSKVMYMLGDYKQALENEYMSLSLSKMSFREDSIEMIQCYSRFGLYHMVMNDKDKALYFLHKSLYLMVLAFTEGYPDILINIANIARIHQQNKDIGQAIKCYVKAVDLLSAVYPSRVHINISFCYSSLASLHYEIDEYRKSVDYQSESAAILAKLLPQSDSRLNDARKILKNYRQIMQNSHKMVPQQQQPPPKPQYQPKEKTDRKKK